MSAYCTRRSWVLRLWERREMDFYHPKLVGALEDVARCSRKFHIADRVKEQEKNNIAKLTDWIHTERTKRERKAAQRRKYEQLMKRAKQAEEAKEMGTSK